MTASFWMASRPASKPVNLCKARHKRINKAGPEAKAEAAPQQAAAAVWYLSRDGKSEGPYDEAALKKMLEGMPPETLVWSEGSPDWISARDAGMVAAPGTVTCPRCGTKANAGKRFCGECGGPLTH